MALDRTVLFLGAGASRALGYPLTRDILPQIIGRLKDRSLFAADADYVAGMPHEYTAVNHLGFHPDAMSVLERELNELFPTLMNSAAPPNITDILSLFDHLIVTGNAALPGFSRERLARLRGLLERGIATVVTAPAAQTPVQRALVDRLVAWLAGPSMDAQNHQVTIITTNYDLAIERPLVTRIKASGGAIDYGFNWRDPYAQDASEDVVHVRPPLPKVSLFKLHGSINWVRCPHCDHVYLNEVDGPIFVLSLATRPREATTCSCGYFPFGTLLVAPSMIRDVRDPSLLSIWQSALEALRLAGRWVMVGYSLPAEDLAIRSMLLRASRGRPAPPNVEVYDEGDQPEILRRYELLLKNPRYNSGGFETFINGLPVAA